MTALTVIIKTERAGRLALHPMAPGLTHAKAEAEASRLRFRDEACNYCVYTGIFAQLEQAQAFVHCRNKGMSIHAAMKQIGAYRP